MPASRNNLQKTLQQFKLAHVRRQSVHKASDSLFSMPASEYSGPDAGTYLSILDF